MIVQGASVGAGESSCTNKCRNIKRMAPFQLSAHSHGERFLDFSMVFQVPSLQQNTELREY